MTWGQTLDSITNHPHSLSFSPSQPIPSPFPRCCSILFLLLHMLSPSPLHHQSVVQSEPEESPTAPVCRASVESSTALHVTWHQESPTAPVCRASVESSTALHVTWHEESPLPQCVERLLNRLQLCMSHGTRCHMARGEPHCPSVSSVC